MSDVTIVGISGSLREGSLNAALLRSALRSAPSGIRMEVGTIRGIPLFDQDVEERDGVPEAVAVLKEQIARSSGVVLATPEYNGAIPGVTKNAIDWLTRPFQDARRIFGGRPIAVISASPLPSAARTSAAAVRSILTTLGARTFDAKVCVPKAFQAFDKDGALIDEQLAGQLKEFMSAFVAFVTAK